MAKLSRATRSRIMSAIRSSGNRSTELTFKRLLRVEKIAGWRRKSADLPGRPDFIFRSSNLAVFLDGCFWHCCGRCRRNLTPSTNRKYWLPKLDRNKARDKSANRALRLRGWNVLRIWEHELRRNPAKVIAKLKLRLKSQGTK